MDFDIDEETQKTKIRILLDTDKVNIIEQLKNENKLSIELTKYKLKRSKNANNYLWKLLSDYAQAKGVDTIQEYKERVKRLGIFRRTLVEAKDVATYKKTWEHWGLAWFCEVYDTEYINNREFKVLHLYYGSSSYNTQQMSRLINDLVEDCKQVGIETKSPNDIQSLLNEWDRKE